MGDDNGNTPNKIKNPMIIITNHTIAYPFLVEENVRSNQSTRQKASEIACEKKVIPHQNQAIINQTNICLNIVTIHLCKRTIGPTRIIRSG